MANREDLLNGTRVKVLYGYSMHPGVIVERPFDHLASEGMVSIQFTPPIQDGNTRKSSSAKVLTCQAGRVELDEAAHG